MQNLFKKNMPPCATFSYFRASNPKKERNRLIKPRQRDTTDRHQQDLLQRSPAACAQGHQPAHRQGGIRLHHGRIRFREIHLT